jgi:hypothetical protein
MPAIKLLRIVDMIHHPGIKATGAKGIYEAAALRDALIRDLDDDLHHRRERSKMVEQIAKDCQLATLNIDLDQPNSTHLVLGQHIEQRIHLDGCLYVEACRGRVVVSPKLPFLPP